MDAFRIILFPLSIIYGSITWLRNKFFDWRILPARQFPVAVISVGNLSLGGTGKTPHIEYLIRLLKKKYPLAILSRGYKRKSKGYQEAAPDTGVERIGDEPLQIYRKHPDVKVAVCASRREGITRLIEQKKNAPRVVLLDDAFQHRYVKPGLNILLTDYHKLFTRNYMVPTGTLREFRSGASRADILVVTKTPVIFSPLERRLILEELQKYNIPKIYFSYVKYGLWVPLTPAAEMQDLQKARTIFQLTGIANPTPLSEHLKRLCCDLKVFNFPDHHQFTHNDISNIVRKYQEVYSGSKAIVTTEKDSMRLSHLLTNGLKSLPVYYVPIEVEFHGDDKIGFDKSVFDYTAKLYPAATPAISQIKTRAKI
jgi:tetraacyldisaccharide 4'-kinase